MLTKAQVKADFLKLVNTPHGNVVTVGFGGNTASGLKSTERKGISIGEFGEVVTDAFTVRIAYDAFGTMPAEKDLVTIDGTSYQVGEVSYSGFGGIAKLFLMDKDAG